MYEIVTRSNAAAFYVVMGDLADPKGVMSVVFGNNDEPELWVRPCKAKGDRRNYETTLDRRHTC